MSRRDTLSELRELLDKVEKDRTPELSARVEDLPILMLTMEQVAQMCQVGLDRVRDWTYEPDFPAIRTAHQVRIHARLLDEWLAAQSLKRGREEDAA